MLGNKTLAVLTLTIGLAIGALTAARPACSLELLEPAEVKYSTYLGGNGLDYAGGCVVDSSLCVYLVGSTDSPNFPTINPYQAGKSSDDVFVAKFDSNGSTLIFSTYLGGSGADYGNGIALDSALNIYITGTTGSYYQDNFPTVNAYQSTFGGGNDDAFVTKFNPSGNALIFSTYLGGDTGPHPYENAYGIAVDSFGCAYVTGYTTSDSFPTVNPYQPVYSAGGGDAFITKFSSTGSYLLFSTYLGGSDSDDRGRAIAVDDAAAAYVTGDTSSETFPTLNAYQASINWNDDAFVTKFNPAGSTLAFSTYLGGDHFDTGYAVTVDSAGNVYVAGDTFSATFPVYNAYQAARAGATTPFSPSFCLPEARSSTPPTWGEAIMTAPTGSPSTRTSSPT
jgi:hypothetical protein